MKQKYIIYYLTFNIMEFSYNDPSYINYNKLLNSMYDTKKLYYDFVFKHIKQICSLNEIKILSLLGFKKIPSKKIITKITLKYIKEKYVEINKFLNIDFKFEYSKKIFYPFMSMLLGKINYKLLKKKIDDDVLITIKNF